MVGKRSNSVRVGDTDDLNSSRTSSSLQKDSLEAKPEGLTSESATPKSWKVWLAALGFCCTIGGIGTAAFWWLTTPPPSPDCQKLSAVATDMERLLCAQESARSGDLPKVLAGIELVSRWTPDHPLDREAQRLVAEWSEPVLSEAHQRIERSDLQGAIELASRIPTTSPKYAEAQAAIAQWQRYWQQGAAIVKAARQAMQAQNWALATAKIDLLKDFSQSYWRTDQVLLLTQLITAEQQGRQFLSQAQTVAKNAQPTQIGTAIALLSRIDTRTYAWSDAQQPLQQWSELLLTKGWQNWQLDKLDDAMTLANPVLKNPNLTQTAQELLWLSQARKHAFASTTTLKPTLPQLWNLSAAISTVQLIPPNSRYSAQAQALLKNWQAQFQDLTLLQLAWGAGDIPQSVTKQLALWQAAQITRDRPRRAQAQTLMAYWRVEIRRLEDQPYLVYARQLAKPGTIPAFKAAIFQAKLISPLRPSRQEAQTYIADWTQSIQAIEDRPILDQAWTVANQGNLQEAIQIASSITVGRSLYGQAQAAIGNWQASIRAAELARIREREATLQRSRTPDNSNSIPHDRAPNLDEPVSSDTFPKPKSEPSPPHAYPPSIYPPGTEPPPSQIRPIPPSVPAYDPSPPTNPAPLYQPYEPVPPPPRR